MGGRLGKSSRVRMSEDKVRTKGSGSSVQLVYDPRGLLGVSTNDLGVNGVLQKGHPTKCFFKKNNLC
jgi:hypothetical protein